MDIALDRTDLNLYDMDPTTKIYTEDHYSFPQYIGKVASVKNTIATQGSVILGDVDSCVISSGAFIDVEAVCDRCVIMEGARIGKGAVVRNAIVAPNIVIPENAKVNEDGEKVVLVDSRWRA